MDLFSQLETQPINLLNKDGMVNYHGILMSAVDANNYLKILLSSIEWRNDEAVIYGKRIITKRQVAWYGEKPFKYTYSNTTKTALPWTKELVALKIMVESSTGETYNSCLLNLYNTGDEGMTWHSDAEKDLKKNGAIASLSFGAERKFSFKHKRNKEKISLVLHHGSLLVMKGATQTNWLHSLPPTKMTDQPRVNLTFRTIVNHQQQRP